MAVRPASRGISMFYEIMVRSLQLVVVYARPSWKIIITIISVLKNNTSIQKLHTMIKCTKTVCSLAQKTKMALTIAPLKMR